MMNYKKIILCAIILFRDTGINGVNAGDLDTSFGTDGIVTTLFADLTNIEIHAAAIQSDGKIVVAGDVTESGTTKFGIARYNTNGSLDSSFGTGGIVTTLFAGSIFSYANWENYCRGAELNRL